MMSRGLYALGFAILLLMVGLSSCVRIQVHVNAPSWLGGRSEGAEPALVQRVPAEDAPGEAVRREAEQRAQQQKQDNLDLLITGAVRVASDAQAWMLKPRAFGGGDGAFTGVSLEMLGYVTERDGSYATLDGRFVLERVRPSSLQVHGTNERFSNEVVVHVDGASARALRTEIIGERR